MISKEEYLKNKIIEVNYNIKQLYNRDDYEDFKVNTLNNSKYISYRCYVREVYNEMLETGQIELIKTVSSLDRSKQKLQDTNKVIKSEIKDIVQISNVLEENQNDLIELLKAVKPKIDKVKIKNENINYNNTGIIHLSDIHFNELVSSHDTNNLYDFTIASKRLKKLAIKSKIIFKSNNINNILIVCTGDLINSDRRLDEKLNMSTNRMKAMLLAFYILKQFILDLSSDFKINVASISGNESRVNQFNEFSDMVVTDNYDYSIHQMLSIHFEEYKNINFIQGDFKEKVIKVNDNFSILLCHGESLKGKNAIQQIIGKYAEKDILIDYVLSGHLHCTAIGDYSAQSSSLVGSNAYSDKGLNFIGKASQNIYIVDSNGSIDRMAIDLQNTDKIIGYSIIKELEAYSARSAQVIDENKKVMELV